MENIMRKRFPRSSQIVAYTLLILGLISLAGSLVSDYSLLAFIGLGLTFWGALLLYMRPESYVKSSLLNATTLSAVTTLNQLIEDHNPQGRPVYLPPESLEETKAGKAFISFTKQLAIPSAAKLATETIVLNNPDGLLLTPPGVALANLYEDTLGTSFTRLDLADLQNKLPKLFIEDLEIANNLEMTMKDNQIIIRITDPIYQDLCQRAQKLRRICNSLGCPLCSSLAIALTRTTGKPVTIEGTQPSKDGKIIEAYYHIIEE